MTARSLFALCMLCVLRSAGAGDAPPDRLELAAEPPVITVPATAPGRRFIELPTLEYRFAVRAACGGERTPRSLSISVADSRVALSAAALEDRAAHELVLTVPARQLAPIAVDDFCVAAPPDREVGAAQPAADEPGSLPRAAADSAARLRLAVPAVMSAQASLVCGGESGTDISYVTQPLAVTLACAAAPAGAVLESMRNAGGR